MKATVISIGNEIVSGSILDSNAAYVSNGLRSAGWKSVLHIGVPDDLDAIVRALDTAAASSSLVVITGGLGPTADDITREAAASFLGKELVVNQDWADRLEKRYKIEKGKLSRRQLSQAIVPEDTLTLENEIGSALGFMTPKSPFVAVMPGVPTEMQKMFDDHLLPLLAEKSDTVFLTKTVVTYGVGESTVDELLEGIIDPSGNPSVGMTVQDGIIKVSVTAHADDLAGAEQTLGGTIEQVRTRLGHHVIGTDIDALEIAVSAKLLQSGTTLAVAESCTGGLITHRLTEISGISAALLLGVVAYSNEAKMNLLDVPEELIQAHGAVSAPVAEKMAAGVRKAAGADFGIGVTGIAGPAGGTDEKPVGLVYIAVEGPHEHRVEEFRFKGNRSGVKRRASHAALAMLEKALVSS